MKTLSANQSKELNKSVASVFTFLMKGEKLKAEKAKDNAIKKADKDNFEIAFNAYVLAQKKEDVKSALMLNASNISAENNSNDALSDANGLSEAEINHDLLKTLSVLGITDAIKANGGKSIFKKEFNNKTDRTKCRNAFQSSIARLLLHTAHNKKDLADKEMIVLKGIADKYYIAESAFKNVNDYCTDNMQADKKSLIKLFIDMQNPVQA